MPKRSPTPESDSGALVPAEKAISAERNLEGWPLWQPADSRGKPKARVIDRHFHLEDGRHVKASVEIGYTQLGMLTTEDQKVFYAIVKLWEDGGRPDTVSFSLRKLARTLKKSWGSNEHAALVRSLRRLADTPLTWFNSYHDSSTKRTVRVLKSFRILEHLQIVEIEDPAERVKSQSCEARFHEITLTNLRNFYTKPLLFETVLNFESGVAQLLYRHLDLVMSDKTYYRRRTRELFDDIGLEADGYRFTSARKRVLERAFRELQGKPLSTGRITSITLEETKDGKDLNAVFTKAPTTGLADALPPSDADAANVSVSAPDTPATGAREVERLPERAAAGPAELVRYFKRTVHGITAGRLGKKELDQAREVLADLDFETARFVVDYALAEARRTNYPIQAFGFVLQYVDRARLARSEQAAPAPVPVECDVCAGANRLLMRRSDGTGTDFVVGCPHSRAAVAAWERERGLTFVGPDRLD